MSRHSSEYVLKYWNVADWDGDDVTPQANFRVKCSFALAVWSDFCDYRRISSSSHPAGSDTKFSSGSLLIDAPNTLHFTLTDVFDVFGLSSRVKDILKDRSEDYLEEVNEWLHTQASSLTEEEMILKYTTESNTTSTSFPKKTPLTSPIDTINTSSRSNRRDQQNTLLRHASVTSSQTSSTNFNPTPEVAFDDENTNGDDDDAPEDQVVNEVAGRTTNTDQPEYCEGDEEDTPGNADADTKAIEKPESKAAWELELELEAWFLGTSELKAVAELKAAGIGAQELKLVMSTWFKFDTELKVADQLKAAQEHHNDLYYWGVWYDAQPEPDSRLKATWRDMLKNSIRLKRGIDDLRKLKAAEEEKIKVAELEAAEQRKFKIAELKEEIKAGAAGANTGYPIQLQGSNNGTGKSSAKHAWAWIPLNIEDLSQGGTWEWIMRPSHPPMKSVLATNPTGNNLAQDSKSPALPTQSNQSNIDLIVANTAGRNNIAPNTTQDRSFAACHPVRGDAYPYAGGMQRGLYVARGNIDPYAALLGYQGGLYGARGIPNSYAVGYLGPVVYKGGHLGNRGGFGERIPAPCVPYHPMQSYATRPDNDFTSHPVQSGLYISNV